MPGSMSHPPGVPLCRRLATFTMRRKILRFKFDIGDLIIFQQPGMNAQAWASGINDAPYITAIITHQQRRLPNRERKEPINIYQAHGCDGRKHYELREPKLALLAKA